MSAGLSAAAIGGIAAGVGAIGGAVISSQGAQSAANTQANAANNATAAQLQMFNTTQGNLQPYMSSGSTALSTLNGQLGTLNTPMAIQPSISNTNWQQYMSPAYSFQLGQGQQALQNSQAASDGVLSGAAMKGLIGYNQQMAGTAFQNAFNDYQTQYGNQFNQYQTQNQNIYNRLSGLANLGENAAANVGQNATQTGANVANTIQSAGNAQAAGTIGTANAISGGLNNGMGYLMLNGMSNGNLFGSSGGGDYGVPGWTPSGS
ncbi:hypothetical protein M3I54_22535 [Paraburkholderia sp. CNPSo 3274]|uniref:hypothetical protein n=1 Tax=Paraburkholderia sp. CNPSo 3274 TaxID=2940932 RepID=UPI0020B71260|nr:hypothetical protein [Paraburkholderia sp. CNPSo 3274]MCP3709724.1 hypothetical protein [Paraburkholderia sp. CNPSo 3274]